MSDKYPYQKRYKSVHGKKMAYLEHGEGDPVIFLHGNPTSSYLWRNVMPHLEGLGRLIAPDLIGMGDSQKLDNSGPDRYTFEEQRKYLFGLFEALDATDNVTLVVHDWGSIFGFHWAHQNASAVKGIAFMESFVAPIPSWDSLPDGFREAVKMFRSEQGEELILKNNLLIEHSLQGGSLRDLSDTEMAEYCRPFMEQGESRRPMLTFPRQVPIEGDPADVTKAVSEYSDWLSVSTVPKLFINAEPGIINAFQPKELIRAWPSVTEVTIAGAHYLQEDSPDQVGEAIANWYPTQS